MDIMLVKWKIKPDMEQDFLDWWREGMENPPEGLINEHLSKVEHDTTSTWDLMNSKYVTYVNVSIWQDKSDWKKTFSGKSNMLPFEDSLRERVWVNVKATHP